MRAPEGGMSAAGRSACGLHIEVLSRAFVGVYAVRDVGIDVADGEIRGVIGPTGAGKSTLFNLISGHLPADHGTITFRGARVDRLAPHRRAALGIAIVFQGARIFKSMTALENVMVGAHARTRHGFAAAALRLPAHRREGRAVTERAAPALGRGRLGPGGGLAAAAPALAPPPGVPPGRPVGL